MSDVIQFMVMHELHQLWYEERRKVGQLVANKTNPGDEKWASHTQKRCTLL